MAMKSVSDDPQKYVNVIGIDLDFRKLVAGRTGRIMVFAAPRLGGRVAGTFDVYV